MEHIMVFWSETEYSYLTSNKKISRHSFSKEHVYFKTFDNNKEYLFSPKLDFYLNSF